MLPCAPGATNQLRLALSARRTQVYLVTSIQSLYRDGITLVRPLLLDRSCCCSSAGLCRSCVSVDATAFYNHRYQHQNTSTTHYRPLQSVRQHQFFPHVNKRTTRNCGFWVYQPIETSNATIDHCSICLMCSQSMHGPALPACRLPRYVSVCQKCRPASAFIRSGPPHPQPCKCSLYTSTMVLSAAV